MIEELEAARSELARAERQAGMLEERQRLAGEIHDTLAQGFTSVVMHLEAAEQALDASLKRPAAISIKPPDGSAELERARRFLWALRPDVVAPRTPGPGPAAHRPAWSEENGIPLHLEAAGSQRPLPAPIEATFLRACPGSPDQHP